MTIELNVENDYQKKVMHQSFTVPVALATKADVLAWRAAWTGALKSWHSPYKTIVDCTTLTVAESPEVKDALGLMVRFFEGLFLKKAVGFGLDLSKGHGALPFEVFPEEDSAFEAVGLREPRGPREPTDFRSAIQVQNHFGQHVMELSFLHPVTLETAAQVTVLKGKLTNNLMQWHSKWNLLVDCANLEFNEPAREPFEHMVRFFRGFFLKEVLGYSPRGPQPSYPFTVYRARHNAAGRLESEGKVSGDDAVCRTQKT